MADAARNAAREAQAAKAKAKLEQERLDEERRQAEDEAERKRIADEIVQKQKEAEEQGRREAAEAAKLKAELEVRQAAEAKAAMEAAAETKKQEEAEKAARRQAAQEQTEREAEESAKRIADALALKAKVEEAAKARGVEGADASNVWALSDEERAAILNDEGGTSVTNLAANVAPKKAPAPKQNRKSSSKNFWGSEASVYVFVHMHWGSCCKGGFGKTTQNPKKKKKESAFVCFLARKARKQWSTIIFERHLLSARRCLFVL